MTTIARAARRRRATYASTPLLLCGLLSPTVYVVADVVAARRDPSFRYADQAVSELFAIGAPTSTFVVRLFTLSSVLLLAFAVGVWWRARRSRRVRFVALMLAGDAIVGLLLWNLFPMHMRGAERTAADAVHLVLATNPFVLLSLVVGAATFRNGFRAYTVVTGVVLLALAAYGFSFAPAVASNGPTPGMGLAERAAQYAFGLWEMVLAVVLWRERMVRRPHPSTPRGPHRATTTVASR